MVRGEGGDGGEEGEEEYGDGGDAHVGRLVLYGRFAWVGERKLLIDCDSFRGVQKRSKAPETE